MSNYCMRQGHAAPTGARKNEFTKCMNCGADFLFEPEFVAEIKTASDADLDVYQGDGKPNTKPSNPKDVIGSKKLSTSLVPSAVVRYAALSFLEGAAKYGKFNWRVAGVRLSIYIDAIDRHKMKLCEGEWQDPVTGVPHLASIIACAGIILDANECGMLTDDRSPISPAAVDMLDNRAPELAAHIRNLFIEYNPHQHVITDATPQTQDGHKQV